MQGAHAPDLSIRLAADPASVPGARRFVVDGLTARGFEHLADVAELIVSELAGNAALHAAAQFLSVTVTSRGGGIRVGVEDDGGVGPGAVSPQDLPTGRAPGDWRDDATTGRGLAIVSILADDWGVEVTPHGKIVWADVTRPDAENPIRPPRLADSARPDTQPPVLPPGWVLVTLAGCPVELSLQQDQHLDELVRELQLMATDRAHPQSLAIAEEISDVLISPAHARLTGRRMAERALSEGHTEVDIQMAMPVEFAAMMRRLHAAVKRADELCEQNQLMALASPRDVRRLRDWMSQEIIAQIERGRPPLSWADFLDATDDETPSVSTV